ncbi:MAG: sulfatase-like hydrolase/transferase, partial [Comamonas sp.]
ENNFRNAFRPLIELGGLEFSAVSPVYGGGTVNAAFEMLTGLPSDRVLNGVIYQEYYNKLGNNLLSLPKLLSDNGYVSKAYHNFNERFWKRNVVMPKLGFEEFFGLGSMDYSGGDYFPRDKVMFDYFLSNFTGEKGFYFFETVYSHGSYESVEDYLKKIEVAVSDIGDFVKEVMSRDQNNVVLIYADHKPALPDFFQEKGYFASKNGRGSVPFIVIDNAIDRANYFIKKANNQPMFCVPKIFNDYYLGYYLPAFVFNEKICSKNYDRGAIDNEYPGWLYHYSLFE